MADKRIEPKGSELLAAAAKKLRAEFNYRRETNPHPGEKGREFEEIVIGFLNGHLPKRFAATRGFVVDTVGAMTGHVDVIIYDQLDAFVFRPDTDNLIVPYDNVAAVLEVKTTLSEADLDAAAQKIAEVKQLKKLEPPVAAVQAEGDSLVISTTRGILFAFESSLRPETVWEHLKRLNSDRPSDHWIDEVVVLDQWSISYAIQPPHLGVQAMYGGKTAGDVPIPAIYVIPVLAKRDDATLSEFMVRLTAHLAFYQRRPSLPFSFFMEPGKEIRTLGGYWFRTIGDLVPVPDSQFGAGNRGSRVEVLQKGDKVLGTIECFPWADGHAICFLGFAGGVQQPIAGWFLHPYPGVQLTTYSPIVRVTSVLPGDGAANFDRALRFFDEPTSPWSLRRM